MPPVDGAPDIAAADPASVDPGFRIEIMVRPGITELLSAADCEAILEAALVAGGAPFGSTVALTLTDDAELAELNAAHMGQEGPTDVLSFPLLPPAAFPAHRGQGPLVSSAVDSFVLPPGEPAHLGDIVVSVERAIAQAEEGRGGQAGDVRWSPADELRLLITHGALHLCGWDHVDAAEEAAMRALEQELLRYTPA